MVVEVVLLKFVDNKEVVVPTLEERTIKPDPFEILRDSEPAVVPLIVELNMTLLFVVVSMVFAVKVVAPV